MLEMPRERGSGEAEKERLRACEGGKTKKIKEQKTRKRKKKEKKEEKRVGERADGEGGERASERERGDTQ